MTAIDPRVPAALPQVGQPRAVRDVRTGWHILLLGAWELVTAAIPSQAAGDVVLMLRDGPHGERPVPLQPTDRMMTRTPQEQIQWIEALRLTRRGDGPVSRVYADELLMRRVADAVRHEPKGDVR